MQTGPDAREYLWRICVVRYPGAYCMAILGAHASPHRRYPDREAPSRRTVEFSNDQIRRRGHFAHSVWCWIGKAGVPLARRPSPRLLQLRAWPFGDARPTRYRGSYLRSPPTPRRWRSYLRLPDGPARTHRTRTTGVSQWGHTNNAPISRKLIIYLRYTKLYAPRIYGIRYPEVIALDTGARA